MRKRERSTEPLESEPYIRGERTFSALFVIIAVGIVFVVLVLVVRT